MDKAQLIAAEAARAKTNPPPVRDVSAHPHLSKDPAGGFVQQFPSHGGTFVRGKDGKLEEVHVNDATHLPHKLQRETDGKLKVDTVSGRPLADTAVHPDFVPKAAPTAPAEAPTAAVAQTIAPAALKE